MAHTSLLRYIHTRFPPIPVLLFSVGYGMLAVGIGTPLTAHPLIPQIYAQRLLCIAVLFLMFLLRARITDEFKDWGHDARYFPDRPAVSGAISSVQLVSVGFFALAIEVVLVFLLGHVVYYTPVLVYSAFMAVEFGIGTFLSRHFTLSFLLHEIVFIWLGLYMIAVLAPGMRADPLQLTSMLSVLVMAPITVELIRKFKPRFDQQGREVPDTYSTVWGRSETLFIVMALTVAVGGVMVIRFNSMPIFIAMAVFYVLFARWGKQSDTMVVLVGAAQFLVFAVLSLIS